MQITCSFRFELQPDKDQRSLMSRTAGCCRLVFNKALALQNELKEQHQKLLTYNELSQKLTAWKKESETIFLREVPSQPLQQTLMDLCKGISDSFRKSGDPAKKGWPHFKSKDIGDGFRLPQIKPEHIDEGNARVKLPKLGWVRYRKSRDMRFQNGNGSWVKGCVKQATVSKEVGKWFISFAVVFEIEQPAMKTLDVGIDLGVVHAVTTSDGWFFDLNTEAIKAQELKIHWTCSRKVFAEHSHPTSLPSAFRKEQNVQHRNCPSRRLIFSNRLFAEGSRHNANENPPWDISPMS